VGPVWMTYWYPPRNKPFLCFQRREKNGRGEGAARGGGWRVPTKVIVSNYPAALGEGGGRRIEGRWIVFLVRVESSVVGGCR